MKLQVGRRYYDADEQDGQTFTIDYIKDDRVGITFYDEDMQVRKFDPKSEHSLHFLEEHVNLIEILQ